MSAISRTFRASFFALAGAALCASPSFAADPPAGASNEPFGIETLPPLTMSKVIGSPDEPLPYRAKRVFGSLKLSLPLSVVREQGSDRLVSIVHQASGAATHIVRFADRADVADVEVLLRLDEPVYDLTFHPDFKNNGFVYVGSNGPSADDPKSKTTRVTRYTMDREPPHAIDPKSATRIIEWPSDGHNGGAVAFGHDTMLYVTSGDGTSDSDTHKVGQDLTRLTAKVLRIDVDHPDPGRQYSVPADNPFLTIEGARGETWAYGMRNPWRMTVDRERGHLWVGDNGQDLWELAYLVRRGDNFGWSVREGSHPFYPDRKPGPTPFTNPAVEHHHSVARSLTGGIVYYGARLPELRGAYIYGDYSTGRIWGIKHDGTQVVWHRELADTTLQITGFGADASGELLVVDYRGELQGGFYTLEPTPPPRVRASFPKRLSETGLFVSLVPLVAQPGMIPYSVNAPLWSDGAIKERYLALVTDADVERKIGWTETRGWNFPDRTVLVKSFALEMEEGNPASKRWIETRLLTRQDGEWVGYSYRWNPEASEATLVESAGEDGEFVIRQSGDDAAAPRKQTWHYPSRAECMVCHSRAANYVLGLTQLQMNKPHDYGGRVDNQLRTLEHLGLLKLPKPPEQLSSLVDPFDAAADLDARARSYLHANCSQCHVAAGGGNAQIDLEFTTPRDKMNVLDAMPLHDKFEISDARLIARGHPGRSVLLERMARRGAGAMPPLATSLVDTGAVELLRQWIAQLEE